MVIDTLLIDFSVIFTGIVYYIFLCIVYLLRAGEHNKVELMLAPWFSFLLVPFIILFAANIYLINDIGRLLALLPIIVYLIYDLWYRLLTRQKPQHHPNRWPTGLIIYLALLQIGSIALNWYGYLVSKLYGNTLVVSYFVMLGCFGYYQYRYKKRKFP